MKIPDPIVLSLRDNLYLTCLAGYSADLFLGLDKPLNKEEENRRWQQAVDQIGRCMSAGLLEIGSPRWMDATGVQDTHAFLHALARHSPYEEGRYRTSRVRYWMDPLLCSTQPCRDLFSRYFADEDALDAKNEGFAAVLDVLFTAHGVEWADHPFIPIGT